MTWANKLAFFVIAVIVVFTTLAYGAVHQPVLAVFYLLVALTVLLWATDGFFSGAVRVNKDPLPFALLAAAIYGFIQIIPFGTMADIAGINGIPRMLTMDPFATRVSA